MWISCSEPTSWHVASTSSQWRRSSITTCTVPRRNRCFCRINCLLLSWIVKMILLTICGVKSAWDETAAINLFSTRCTITVKGVDAFFWVAHYLYLLYEFGASSSGFVSWRVLPMTEKFRTVLDAMRRCVEYNWLCQPWNFCCCIIMTLLAEYAARACVF